MVGMTSAEIITDAGHCSTLHIMNMAISSHCHVPMLGLAERFHKPSITQHTVDINIIIFLCYTLPKQQLPRMDRCTATSNSGKQHPAIQTSYFAQKPAQINELYISNWHVLQQTSHISLNKKNTKKRPTNKTWNSHGQIYGAKNKSSFPGCEVWRLFFEVWGWCLSFEVGLPPTMCHVGGVGWACCLLCWVQSIFRAPILFCSHA